MRAWLQLIRLPNLFTAPADILAGWCLIAGDLEPGPVLFKALAASVLLYAGGVVLNDVFDVQRDRVERPERPIPSGRIGLKIAFVVGMLLLIGGGVSAVSASRATGRAGLVLLVTILLYDGAVKSTFIGPGVMGWCRAFNLLMGMCAAGLDPFTASIPLEAVLLVLAIWAYITGVTWFARNEAIRRPGERLLAPLLLCSAGLALVPVTLVLFEGQRRAYSLVAVALFAAVSVKGLAAAKDASPARIQTAVKWMVLGWVVLDAAVAFVCAGHLAGWVTLSLLVPATVIGRRLHVT